MKLFSKINENSKQEFQIDSNLRLRIKSENEGEAGYLADSILSGIEEMEDYEILNISKLDPIIESSSEWTEVGGYLQKSFEFDNFKESINFVNKISELSEKENHHPNIQIDLNRVVIKLRTHDVNKVTDLDRQFAQKADNL
jgi:4a-hydroxytetrahydrobiopterin dehydratase